MRFRPDPSCRCEERLAAAGSNADPVRAGSSIARTSRSTLCSASPLIAIAAMSLPGLHVPTGIDNGLPAGVQLSAGSFREQRLLAAGRVIERDARMPRMWEVLER
ncbi:hypothetical protein [Cupriavidus gilardii]|uniref:hypothetical protein n=1 Tax=Cupriavidus gilardii TaxID=82541 RepID=UPI001ABEDE9F